MECDILTRDDMLSKLKEVAFKYIWPESEWDDVGFTEREIWVNSKGYGYLCCDEHNGAWYGQGIETEKAAVIKKKIKEKSLMYSDIKDTSLVDLLNAIYGFPESEYDDLESFDLSERFLGFLDIPDSSYDSLYCVQDPYGTLIFFCNEDDYRKSYERDWCDYYWDELDDDILNRWIKRLF